MDFLVENGSVSGASDGEEVYPMEGIPTPSDNTEENPGGGEKLATVNSIENLFIAVEVISHVDKTYEVSHALRTINK